MENIPRKILGYSIKTKWQITLNYLIPSIVELIVYVTVMIVDSALVYQHFLDKSDFNASITLVFMIVPAILTFIATAFNAKQLLSDSKYKNMIHLFAIQFLYLLTFPICATYRFSRKIFWCIESLFHEKDSYERHMAISKAAENSQFELYHFLQSFFQCAPQIMFQLYIILRDDMFRNYDTAFVQALSVVFSLIKMSMSVESYQRFESQKIVGRSYPWQPMNRKLTFGVSSLSAVNLRSQISEETSQDKQLPNDLGGKLDDEKRAINFAVNITDDEKLNANFDADSRPKSSHSTKMLDDTIDSTDEHRISFRNSLMHPLDGTLHRLSALKKSFISNTESFIREKIPRAPEHIFSHPENENEEEKKNFLEKATTDDVDGLKLPTKREIITGIESDDLIAKFIAFLGWNFFLIMRLMSLSVFAVFHLDIFGWLCFFHYCLMLLLLVNETKFQVKWQRTAFYTILAFIYIFNLIEFKIKFKKIRFWYVSYFLIVFIQNISMTISWYCFEEFLDTWWFEFMFLLIIQSGIMSLMCFLIYFFYLKPKDKLILS